MKLHPGVAAVLSSVTVLAAVALLLVGRAAAQPAPPTIVTGQDAGWPDVRGWDRYGNQAKTFAPWGDFPLAFSPYPTYQNGVRVAVGDVDGDGRNEIVTTPGKSGFTEPRVFDGRTFALERTLQPFGNSGDWWAGAFVATGDTNGDGRAEIVEGLDAGCCTTLHVLDAVSGKDLSGFFPFGDRSEVGARVAAGDINGDGKAEILAAPIGSFRISAFAPGGGASFRSFTSFGAEANDRFSFAAGDLVGDARAEIVAAAPTSAGAQVKIIEATSGATLASFAPYGPYGASSVEVALGDVDGDGHLDIVLSALTPDGTEVKAIDTSGKELDSFYVLDPSIVPGASLAAGDLNGDDKAEIVLGGGPTTAPWPPVANGPDQRVDVFRADGTPVGGFTAYPGLFQGGVRVALADFDHDRRPEIVTAPGPGMGSEIGVFSQEWVEGRDRGDRLSHFLAFEPSFQGGASLAAGDVGGNGDNEILVASGPGRPPEVRVFDLKGRQISSLVPFEAGYQGGLSVAVGDLNADGRPEIVVGTLAPPARIRAFTGGVQFGPTIPPFPAGGPGVEVGVADVDGSGHGLIVAGGATGVNPPLALVDPLGGGVVRSTETGNGIRNGIRVAGGDLEGDGRDEIVVSSGWGGDGVVRTYNGRLDQIGSFGAYPYPGWGMNVAVQTRAGLPIAADARTVRLKARRRVRVIVARFHDAGGDRTPRRDFRASIDWGDGTSWNGVVLARGGGVYDVRSLKRYARAGRYQLTVTFTDRAGRSSIARGKAVVSRR
jgi:FG-GAP-like repeat